jgi:hypothetical protein
MSTVTKSRKSTVTEVAAVARPRPSIQWHDPQIPYYIAAQTGVPVLCEGMPGSAKTATHYALAAALGRRFILNVGSCMAPEDLGGLPIPDHDAGFVRMMPIEWAKIASMERCLILFDELTSVGPDKQAPMLTTIQDRRCGDTHLHPDTLFAAACNPPAIATNGMPLSKPMANRFFHHQWKPNVKVWRAGLSNPVAPLTWEAPTFPILPDNWHSHFAKWGALVDGFIGSAPDRVEVMPTDDETLAFPTMRSWTNLVKVLAACDAVGAPEDIHRHCMDSTIGRAVSLEFSTYIHNLDLDNPEEVLDGKDWTFDIERPDRGTAFLSALWVAVKTQPTAKRWTRAMDLMLAASDYAPELACLYMRDALELKSPGLMPSPEMLRRMQALVARTK